MRRLVRSRWFPLACLFAAIGIIVAVLALAGAFTGPVEALTATAVLLAGLGTVFLATVRRRG
ncbi:hypothetical protein Daura_31480 [Dactylosporangium aurantiacum]|uniref:Uncharacterized protein n=1 Tax=Dactylosporangium aurantiacum TaxID=35754 RepID=A0A9Q9MIU3_9ACTN|nr:hypothetical protein [Dactylosporangium aurantiacum]MDG6109579.1 hypothetical protein [Dactylosporangium aurantiacum]UWZ51267.1 hypothetical protein Daura_31480 [Dactylosporangium aurantiacum]